MIAMVLSLIILILSDSRPLVEVEINGRPAVMLVDTGSSVSAIDINRLDDYGARMGRSAGITLYGIGSKSGVVYVRDAVVSMEGILLHQFVAYDLSGVVKAVYAATGIRISGIIGYPQIRQAEMIIDSNNNMIQLGYGSSISR